MTHGIHVCLIYPHYSMHGPFFSASYVSLLDFIYIYHQRSAIHLSKIYSSSHGSSTTTTWDPTPPPSELTQWIPVKPLTTLAPEHQPI